MPKSRAPSSFHIPIDVQAGRPVCTPRKQRVHRGDTVTWACASAYAVHFKTRTPFDTGFVPGAPGDTVQLVVRARAPFGSYKYSVIVFEGRGAPLFDDPEIYVDVC